MSFRAVASGQPDLSNNNAQASNDEVLYESERTYVVRRHAADGSTVVLKQALSADAVRRLCHERNLLERVAGVDGTAKLASGNSDADVLALHDDAGVALGKFMATSSLPVDEVLWFGLRLSRILANVHRAGVVHKDINPSNILLCGPERRPVLIDFNIAAAFAEEHASFQHEKQIAGTMAYMPPEQTGRTGRPVDHRSDLYALGAVLFQLIAGRPVFESEDLLELLQNQLTVVPPTLAELLPGTPPVLSALVARLLEKEPDRRYQSADGVAHDLHRLIQARSAGDYEPFVLAERDFAAKLRPPSRLIGREHETAPLRAALHESVAGPGVCLLVAGGIGVGKTALVNELKAELAASRGWFVSGHGDQHRQDGESQMTQALRMLGRLLLSEPEETLVRYRERLITALGANIAAGIARIPEFELLLGQQPHTVTDPLDAERRLLRSIVDTLASIASPERPLVMLLDDMQWASDSLVRFVDALMSARAALPGLLLVMAYRHDELVQTSLFTARLPAWQQLSSPPHHLVLKNLSPEDVGELVSEMLRLAPEPARRLGDLLGERSRGNPQDTIELINALRADGLLEPGTTGWHWDARGISRYVGENEGVDLLTRRLGKLPANCLSLLQTMACLSSEVPRALLDAAREPSTADTLEVLAPALDDRLLVAEPRSDGVLLRWRNNRVQECVHSGLRASGCAATVKLAIARRLALSPTYGHESAQLYLDVLEDVADPSERRLAAAMLHRAAASTMVVNYPACERFLDAAIRALMPIEAPEDSPLVLTLMIERHLVLYGLGRPSEGDELYTAIASRCDTAAVLAAPAGVQVHSLTNRLRYAEALALGLRVLEDGMGLTKPADFSTYNQAGVRAVAAWAIGEDKQSDMDRPDITDPHLKALAVLLKRVLGAAFAHDRLTYGWLLVQAHRLWVERGPSPELMTSVASIPLLLASTGENYRAAHAAGRHAIDVSRARGYETGLAMAQVLSGLCATHWCEPIEEVLLQSRQSRVGLLRASDILYTTYTYNLETMSLIESAPTLDEAETNVAEATAFQAATGSTVTLGITVAYRQWIRAMRGQTKQPGVFEDDEFNHALFLERYGKSKTAPVMLHTLRALAATIFNDHAARRRWLDAAAPELGLRPGAYTLALYYLMQGLALAEEVRTSADAHERETALAQLDESVAWMNARAADAPINFLHLARLIAAERAWAVGAMEQAAAAYDLALTDADQCQRPWHRALIGERSARFYAARGWERTVQPLLAEALRGYDEWGAAGKVAALYEEFPFLRIAAGARKRVSGRSTVVSTDAVDVMAILRASQLLSSETSLPKLNASVTRILSAICGAETVLLVVRPQETPGWFLATSLDQGDELLSLEAAAARGQLPLSAFRYAERTREPLLVADAMHDHRFAADPALAGLSHCSLLLVPILKQGEMHAMLVLENRTRHSAFSIDRLDSVKLIAGQLTVSLDNALLYASLARKVADRTAALEETNRQLELLSVTDALTGLANRRHFNQALAAEWNRAIRAGLPVGIAMIDVDQFKQYNDHYGHHGGDVCLKLVADAMRSELRVGSHMIARYGGEEFVLLLFDTDLAATRVVAERMRSAVAARREPHETSTHGVVTISVGIASTVPKQGSDPALTIAAADAALYHAKSAGRNRVAGSNVEQDGENVGFPRPDRVERDAEAPSSTQSLSTAVLLNDLGFIRWQRGRARLNLSPPVRAALGYAADAPVTLRQLLRSIDAASWSAFIPRCRQALCAHRADLRAELVFQAADRRLTMHAALTLAYAADGTLAEFVVALQNTSQQTALVEALSESQERLSEAYQLASSAYWEWDFNTKQAKFSAGALRLLRREEGWKPTWKDIKELSPADQREWVASLYLEAYEKKLPSLRYELHYPQPGGGLQHLHTIAKLEYDENGNLRRIMATFQDVTELKTYRRQLHSLSFFDPLTNLPNRASFVERLREACSVASAQGQSVGLLMLDLDRFKQVNDSLGHAAGDALLQQAAERLNQTLRTHDTVARLSGDEFAVMLPELRHASDMNGISQKVLHAFALPFTVVGKEVFISASIGGALFPAHAKDVEQLLQFADAALYHAKAQGRNNFQHYSPALTDKAKERLALEAELRRGLERGELELFYQPKFGLSSRKLVGAEALMRWNHPQRGLVSPDEFIPLAEETGLIVAMGVWALDAACRRAAQWNAKRRTPLKIAVNLSARQLSGDQLATTVRKTLQATGCQPQWLELEITESLLLEGRGEIQDVLKEIADLGITIAIDDFGTGYSALSYLTRFPIRVLKIDRSFIKQVPDDRSGAELVKGIVSLGHSLNMELVAEGVETHEQAAYLTALGCEFVQGFLFGKPMPASQFEALAANGE